jgi:hypothetical protein
MPSTLVDDAGRIYKPEQVGLYKPTADAHRHTTLCTACSLGTGCSGRQHCISSFGAACRRMTGHSPSMHLYQSPYHSCKLSPGAQAVPLLPGLAQQRPLTLLVCDSLSPAAVSIGSLPPAAVSAGMPDASTPRGCCWLQMAWRRWQACSTLCCRMCAGGTSSLVCWISK